MANISLIFSINFKFFSSSLLMQAQNSLKNIG